MEIRSTIAGLPNIYGVFGFGSYFRGEPHNDIDILVVSSPYCRNTLELFYQVKEGLGRVDDSIDLTLLTYREFIEKPLIEHDQLIEIYKVA